MSKRFEDKEHRLSENDLESISGGRDRISTSIIGLAAAYIASRFIARGVKSGLDYLLDKLGD